MSRKRKVRRKRRKKHTLKGVMIFPAYSAIFVTSTYGKRRLSARAFKQRIRSVARFYTKSFGGSTRYRGHGTVITKGKVISEKVAKVESYAMRKKFSKVKLLRWARKQKTKWKQDSVAVEIEGRRGDRDLYFV